MQYTQTPELVIRSLCSCRVTVTENNLKNCYTSIYCLEELKVFEVLGTENSAEKFPTDGSA